MITIPTIQELKDAILADLQSELGVSIPAWGKNILRVLAVVQAAKLKVYYLAIAKLQKNTWVDTAEPEAAGGTLERYGRVKLGRNPFPATQGQYQVSVTGLFGGVVPAGTTFLSDDSTKNPGKLFILDTEYVLPGTTGTVILRALESGVQCRLAVGETLTSTSPIINVDGGVVVVFETVIPNDSEDLELYREKAGESFRLEPQGGASADYRLWGKDVSGVQQIYPYAVPAQPNTVDVYVEATVADSTDGMGTPTGTILIGVAEVIETDPVTNLGRRPMGIFAVNVKPVVVNKIFVEIEGFQGLTLSKQNLIFQAISEALNKIRPFIGGADKLPSRNDTLSENNIINIILSTLPGSIFNSIVLTYQVAAGPVLPFESRVFHFGNIPFLSDVTYA